MKTIKERSTDCLVHINGMTQGDAIRKGIEYHLLGLLKDIEKLIESTDSETRGEILEEIRKIIPPSEPEVEPFASIDERAQKMLDRVYQIRRSPEYDAEAMKAMFAAHLEMLTADCVELITRARRNVIKQCGGDARLNSSEMSYTGYSVATMLAQLAEAIQFMGMNKIPWGDV